jgi:hypothetical protein
MKTDCDDMKINNIGSGCSPKVGFCVANDYNSASITSQDVFNLYQAAI